MALIADILLLSGALSVAFYCFVLSRRLRRFTDLEHGVGGAVAVLSAQVDDLSRTLGRAQATASQSVTGLTDATERAAAASAQLELLLASLHDLPEPQAYKRVENPFFVRTPVKTAATTPEEKSNA